MMKRLMKVDILPSLRDSYESCVEYVKWKLTKIKIKGSNRSPDLLENIHTDAWGPCIMLL